MCFQFTQRWLIKLIIFFSLNLFSNTFYSGNRARAPNQQTPVKSASRIRYCCNYEKVCLHLFSWPCLQWMSSYFAYLTNLLFYKCTITATAKSCYPESGEMYQITLEKLLLILTSEFTFFKLNSLYDSEDYIIDNTAIQTNCLG